MAFAITPQSSGLEDAYLRARAGMALSPEDDGQVAPVGSALPQVQTAQPYKPSLLDVLQGVLFDGSSPAEAAMSARQRNYQAQTMGIMADALRNASPDERKAILFNPAEFGKAMASHVQDMVMKEGETRNSGVGGPSFLAPKTGLTSGDVPYVIDSRGFRTLAPQLPGQKEAKDGIVLDKNLGPTGDTYSLPQLVAPGSVPNTFTPTVGSRGPAPAATAPPQGGGLDPVAFFKSFVLPHEGGLNPRDLNGSPTKYGINQAANPGVDVTKITPEEAADIFKNKYFAQSGAAHLPPALAAVHADTSFINPKKAAEFLTQSGGDPSKYMDMREAWLNGIVQKYPAAQKYAEPWAHRNADLRKVAAQYGGGSAPSAAGFSGPAAKKYQILDPADPGNAGAYANLPKGTLLQRAPDGQTSVLHEPEYSPATKATLQDQFQNNEAYKQNQAATAAVGALIHNIGKMNGPAAYSILDTWIRAINPGAVARQGSITAAENQFGIPAHLMGSLQNFTGNGKIPLKTQQDILNAVIPFAQQHYDQAKTLYDQRGTLATSKKFDPDEIRLPIGDRPMPAVIVQTPPPANQRHAGVIYIGPKGPGIWTGTAWQPLN